MDVKRNDPCPCGSGKKYKKCCGLKEAKAKAKTFSVPRSLAGFGNVFGPPDTKNPLFDLTKRVMRVLESEESVVPPDYIPESHASTEEAENPELPEPGSAKSLS
jgi:hypothetical protein